MNLPELCDVALDAARAAGSLIQEYRQSKLEVNRKQGGDTYASQVVTEVDIACEALIIDRLKDSCTKYNIALLSEEMEDDGSRFDRDYFWCIDPMDGTLPFINGYPGYAVSIALVSADGVSHIGVVCDPSSDIIYHAIRGGGAYKNGKLWSIAHKNSYLSYITDKSLHDTPRSVEIIELIKREVDQLGLSEYRVLSGAGAVMNAIRVLEHGPAVMLKMPKETIGGGCIWDYAATSCIYNEMGRVATDFHGEPLDLNKKDGPYMNNKGVYFKNV